MLVGVVHLWPAPVSVGGLIVVLRRSYYWLSDAPFVHRRNEMSNTTAEVVFTSGNSKQWRLYLPTLVQVVGYLCLHDIVSIKRCTFPYNRNWAYWSCTILRLRGMLR
jgi:hypothetical protein